MLDLPCAKCHKAPRVNKRSIMSYCLSCYEDVELGSRAAGYKNLTKLADWYRPAEPDMPEDESDLFTNGFNRTMPGYGGRRFHPRNKG